MSDLIFRLRAIAMLESDSDEYLAHLSAEWQAADLLEAQAKQIDALSLALETERGAANLYAQQVAHWIGKYDDKLKQIEELQADAERYRVLRDDKYQRHEDDISVSDSSFNVYFGAELDEAVAKQVPPGYKLVPVEVVNLYNFMDAAFAPMTGQQEQIQISLDAARAAMIAAAPDPKEAV